MAHCAIAELEDTLDELPLLRLDGTTFSTFAHESPDILLCDLRLWGVTKAYEAQHELRRVGEEGYHWTTQARDQAHGWRHETGVGFGLDQGDALGNQFAEDQTQVGDDQYDEPKGELISVGCS